MKMESLHHRREELERKEFQLKESLVIFDKFLKVSSQLNCTSPVAFKQLLWKVFYGSFGCCYFRMTFSYYTSAVAKQKLSLSFESFFNILNTLNSSKTEFLLVGLTRKVKPVITPFSQAECPSWRRTNSVKTVKA